MAHSKTPWAIDEDGVIVDADGNVILTACEPEDEAFIVKAVNAFVTNQTLVNQLVDALSSAKAVIWAMDGTVHYSASKALAAAKAAGFYS